jgi:membrane-associated PAP2 superfamily phosphatase
MEPKSNNFRRLSGFRASIVFFRHVIVIIRYFWPIVSMLLAFIMLLGLITGIREDWTIGNSFYYAFITAFTIGYGDLAPTYPLTKILAVAIGLFGFLFTGVLVAIAVESVRLTYGSQTALKTCKK